MKNDECMASRNRGEVWEELCGLCDLLLLVRCLRSCDSCEEQWMQQAHEGESE
jgi:hypothetical protein